MHIKIGNLSLIVPILCIFAVCVSSVLSKPSEQSPGVSTIANEREEGYEDLTENDYLRVKPCILNMTTMELCMRCAKVTKSPIVYPMCCSNEERVFIWCTEYIYYGRMS